MKDNIQKGQLPPPVGLVNAITGIFPVSLSSDPLFSAFPCNKLIFNGFKSNII